MHLSSLREVLGGKGCRGRLLTGGSAKAPCQSSTQPKAAPSSGQTDSPALLAQLAPSDPLPLGTWGLQVPKALAVGHLAAHCPTGAAGPPMGAAPLFSFGATHPFWIIPRPPLLPQMLPAFSLSSPSSSSSSSSSPIPLLAHPPPHHVLHPSEVNSSETFLGSNFHFLLCPLRQPRSALSGSLQQGRRLTLAWNSRGDGVGGQLLGL